MRPALLFALIIAVPRVFAYGVESHAGLRSAERESATKIVVVCGPGTNAGEAEKRARVFQIASATDRDFQLGIAAESVRVTKTEDDVAYPDGWAGPRFQRYTIEVTLPAASPMKAEHKYWLRINSPWVMAKNRQACYIVEKGATPAEDLDPRTGIREVHILTPRILHIITGPGLDVARLSDMSAVSLTASDGDADFATAVHPLKVGRRSNLDAYISNAWPWKFLQRHELFLVFEKGLKNGKSYSVDFNAKAGSPALCGTTKATLQLNDKNTIDLAIKVNQCGYLPDAEEKFAYAGMWMGDLNACDFAPYTAFEVRDAKSHDVVLEGNATLRGKATYKLEAEKLTPDPKQTPGPEGVYKQDLSYEDVYQLDLSALKKEGEYYIALPKIGRSFSFKVAKDVYKVPFETLMNGLFHQRSGIELKEPWTKHYSPAGHRNKTEYSTFRAGIDPDPFKNLPSHATDGVKHDLYGGHHDAGDWNPRSHLEVAEVLFLLYEMNKPAFADGQLKIPEAGNGIPDILDEAFWALDLWTRLQDDDGGVHNGIESNGDPDEQDIAATDRLREFAFAKDAAGSYGYAAVAAQASIIWKELGRTQDAANFLDHAVRAWNWAEKNGGENEHDRHVFAAAMLFRATHDAVYDTSFHTHSVFTKNPAATPDAYGKYNQIYGSYYYATLPNAAAKLKGSIVASFENEFKVWADAAATTHYRYLRNPWAPNTWGTGGLPVWLLKPAMTSRLTASAELKNSCRKWITLTNDFSLGCDPLSLVFTVGLGQRYVTSAWHLFMLNSPAGIIPGLQTEGPGGNFISGSMPKAGGMGEWPGMSFYPPGPWPDLYKYSEDASPGMNEGVCVNMVNTAFAYGLLLPGKQKD